MRKRASFRRRGIGGSAAAFVAVVLAVAGAAAMGAPAQAADKAVTVVSPWSVVGVGKLSGTIYADEVVYNSQTGETQIWSGDNSQLRRRNTVIDENGQPIYVGAAWSIVAVGDLNGASSGLQGDIIWHNSVTGWIQIWYMKGSQIVRRANVIDESGVMMAVGLPWSIAGSGDLDGNGKDDIVWRNSDSGWIQIWYMNGDQIVRRANVIDEQGVTMVVGLPWSIVGVGDLDPNGKDDIVWHNSDSGWTQIWHMNGDQIVRRANVVDETGATMMTVGLPWSIVGVGNQNSGGPDDIVWRTSDTGEIQTWYMTTGDRISTRSNLVSAEPAPPPAPQPCAAPNPLDFPSSLPTVTQQWNGLSRVNDGIGDLRNNVHNRQLYNTHRTFGEDLDWTTGSWVWKIETPCATSTVVKGQKVAIRVWGGGWMHFNGFAVVLQDTPAYEWRSLGSSYKTGASLPDDSEGIDNKGFNIGDMALWNDTAKDFLVYGNNVTGGPGAMENVNVVWYKQSTLNPEPPGPPAPAPTPQPPLAQPGVEFLRVFNCSTTQHTVTAWVKDTTNDSAFQNKGTIASHFDSLGCEAKDSAPFTFTPVNQHNYQVILTDPLNTGCTTNDPLNTSCVVDNTTFLGNAAGAIQTNTLGHGTVRSRFSLYIPMTATTAAPPVTGLSQAAAQNAFTTADLNIGTITTLASTAPPGTVITQSQPAGTLLSVDSPIDITVAVPVLTTDQVSNRTTTVGVAKTLQLSAAGGTQPYTWSVTGLPTGMTSTSTGLISGTPTVINNYTVTYTATDSAGASVTKTFTWLVWWF